MGKHIMKEKYLKRFKTLVWNSLCVSKSIASIFNSFFLSNNYFLFSHTNPHLHWRNFLFFSWIKLDKKTVFNTKTSLCNFTKNPNEIFFESLMKYIPVKNVRWFQSNYSARKLKLKSIDNSDHDLTITRSYYYPNGKLSDL